MTSSRVALKTLRDSLFGDNTTGLVSPAKLRTYLDAQIDSDYNLTDDSLYTTFGNQHINYFLAGPSSGSAGPVTFRPITAADLPFDNGITVTGDILLQSASVVGIVGVGDSGVDISGPLSINNKTTFPAGSTAEAPFNLPVGAAPTSPVDGDVWRENNTNTGLKTRINGVTKTIVVV